MKLSLRTYKVQPKKFSVTFVLAIFFTLFLSELLYVLDKGASDNDVIRRYQLDKIKQARGIDTLIVGDSSAGNAIDAAHFSELSGRSTMNVALTGSFGLPGSLIMMDKAFEEHPEIKNIIIIHAVEIWSKPFPEPGVFELARGRDLKRWAPFVEHPSMRYIEYSVKLNNIVQAISNIFFQTSLATHIPSEILQRRVGVILFDYIQQQRKTFSNGQKKLTSDVLDGLVDVRNQQVYLEIDAWCGERNVYCLYLHGPLLEDVHTNSLGFIEKINDFLALKSLHIRPFPEVPYYEAGDMGDSINHVLPSRKKDVTRGYFNMVAPYLN